MSSYRSRTNSWNRVKPDKPSKAGRNGIAAVLIVKNEEKVLERCLKSLDMVDQIVVLDTGSIDRTVEIAKDFTSDVEIAPKIEPFHFGEARNLALNYVKQDWCLTIDADEVVKEGSINIIRKAFWTMGKAVGFNVTFTLYNELGQNPGSLMKLKVFRHGRWEWRYRIHEILFCKKDPMTVGNLPEAVIEHFPSADHAARSQQNLDLLQIAVKESPEYVRNSRQLGMEFFSREDWQGAVKWLKLYLDMAKSDRMDRSETLVLVGRCYSNMGRYDMAEPFFEDAIQEAPERREIYYHKALALIKALQLEEAQQTIEKCLEIPATAKPDFHLNVESIWNGTQPQEILAFCKSTIAEAKAEFERRKVSG
jgi:glycosyltransferase involved in cell wall biosynthesis